MRLSYQLFLSLLLTGGLLITLMATINGVSFNRGFIGYINQTEREKLDPLVEALARSYAREGSWQWIATGSDLWGEMLDEYLDIGRKRDFAGSRGQQPRPPDRSRANPEALRASDGPRIATPPRPSRANDAPLTLDPRLLLADAEQHVLIGREHEDREIHWQPINIDEQTVGFLGHRERQTLSGQLDQAFASQQRRSVVYAAATMVLLSALLALVLANRLVRPLLAVNRAVARIGRGQYDLRVPDGRSDELGDLSRSINTLALTLEKNRGARQQWLAEISHELRTPVAILQGELEAIQDGVNRLDNSAISSLHSETLRLARLIDDLHDLTLSDIGALNYQFEPLDLQALLMERIRAARLSPETTSLTIHVTPPNRSAALGEPPRSQIMVNGDAQRLGQLVDNLLQNSHRYTDAGGEILVDVVRTRDRAAIDWSDSAPGVDDEQLGRLFEPLYRGDTSRHRDTGGAGLGLAIVQRIVDAHGGKIDATHAAIGGLAIHIELPLLQENAA